MTAEYNYFVEVMYNYYVEVMYNTIISDLGDRQLLMTLKSL